MSILSGNLDLDSRWKEWFDGFEMQLHGEDTVLRGNVPYQGALHGVLAKIRDFGLIILLVENITRETNDE